MTLNTTSNISKKCNTLKNKTCYFLSKCSKKTIYFFDKYICCCCIILKNRKRKNINNIKNNTETVTIELKTYNTNTITDKVIDKAIEEAIDEVVDKTINKDIDEFKNEITNEIENEEWIILKNHEKNNHS